MGGYPRLWFGDGTCLDLPRSIPDEQAAEYAASWRVVHVRVEWLRSPRGRIDHLLPQTLERYRSNANVRSWREHKTDVM